MREFKIGGIPVGGSAPVVVVPEIGINHGGSLKTAFEMADAAKRAGARLIKHQTHIVDDEMSKEAKSVKPGNADKSIYEIMEQCALSGEEEFEFFQYVKSIGLEFLSTPFSRAAADRLEKFGVSAYKIGSGEMNNYPLIKHIAAFGKPMIVSTGMNDIETVRKTVSILEEAGVPFALMHTTNLYPTAPSQVRLGAMQQLMSEFPEVPVGLSDHTCGNLACICAIALGAKIVERHFTDIMSRQGPDIVCSMDEQNLRRLIKASNEIPLMLGGEKKPLPEEQVTIDFAFASVVSINDIKAGEEFTTENIWVKRPGTGQMNAEKYENILGKRAACDIPGDTMIEFKMIENE